MYFVGLDLAWGERSPTGVAVLDAGGGLVHVAPATGDADVLAQVRPFTAGECVVGIDAPLVVTNPTGNRPCETALNRDFRAFDAGAYPANTGLPWFADGTRGGRLAERLQLDLNPYARHRRALEVYPHAATVRLFGLACTLKYKSKPGRDIASQRAELLRLLDLLEGAARAQPPLRLDHPDWTALRTTVETATRKSELRRAEDPVDAVVCAYVAMFAHCRPADVTVYGDPATGCIVTPTPPPGWVRCAPGPAG